MKSGAAHGEGMKHTQIIENFAGPHEQLAEDLGNLYYDALAEFLIVFAAKMARDSEADRSRGRPRLAAELDACDQHLDAAARHIRAAWDICAPHVTPDATTDGR